MPKTLILLLLTGMCFGQKAPKNLRVCYKASCSTYKVEMVHYPMKDSDCVGVPGTFIGCSTYSKRLIQIANWGSPEEQAQTLTHEAMHAIMRERGIFDQNIEKFSLHDAIYILEEGLTRLIIDNPDYVKFLRESNTPVIFFPDPVAYMEPPR